MSDDHSLSGAVFFAGRGHGSLIGVHESPDGVDPEHVVIKDEALGCVGTDQERWMRFDEIDTAHGPQSKDVDEAIAVVMKSGTQTELRIAGGDGRFRDVFSCVRFLDRVAEDRRNR